jgi:hypothetical protein
MTDYKDSEIRFRKSGFLKSNFRNSNLSENRIRICYIIPRPGVGVKKGFNFRFKL